MPTAIAKKLPRERVKAKAISIKASKANHKFNAKFGCLLEADFGPAKSANQPPKKCPKRWDCPKDQPNDGRFPSSAQHNKTEQYQPTPPALQNQHKDGATKAARRHSALPATDKAAAKSADNLHIHLQYSQT